jgi:hypothetical protein
LIRSLMIQRGIETLCVAACPGRAGGYHFLS